MATNVRAIRRTARRSARALASWSDVSFETHQTITRALLTSTTESSPKPTSAMEPAARPLITAMIASRPFQTIVRTVNAQAHRRIGTSIASPAGPAQHAQAGAGPSGKTLFCCTLRLPVAAQQARDNCTGRHGAAHDRGVLQAVTAWEHVPEKWWTPMRSR